MNPKIIDEFVGVAVGETSLRLRARLDADRLDPSEPPDVITGCLNCADGSVEAFLLHAEDEKRMWFCGNAVSYRFVMEKGTGNRFTATVESRQVR